MADFTSSPAALRFAAQSQHEILQFARTLRATVRALEQRVLDARVSRVLSGFHEAALAVLRRLDQIIQHGNDIRRHTLLLSVMRECLLLRTRHAQPPDMHVVFAIVASNCFQPECRHYVLATANAAPRTHGKKGTDIARPFCRTRTHRAKL
jgi:hypothetical protein